MGWAASLLLLLAAIGVPPVQRTQEARVLITAREMHDLGGERWIIPRMNGELRLEKPPLAYWMSAVSFALAGGVISETAGRVPSALCGWLTIGITYALCVRWFASRTAAFLAGASLLSGALFYRHSRLAETDAPTMLFVTLAVYAMCRAADAWRDRRAGDLPWHALSGGAVGLAALAKGPPALFTLLFLVGLALVRRDHSILLRWLRSGAALIALVIGGAWYLYIARALGVERFQHELSAAVAGEKHAGSVFSYVPMFLRATLPWSPICVLAIVVAATRWTREPRVREPLVWAAAIVLPLLIARQRQPHYLLPLMPAAAALTGWFLAWAVYGPATRAEPDDRERARTLVRVIFVILIACGAAGAVGLPFIARATRGEFLIGDAALSAALLSGMAGLWTILRTRGLAVAISALAVAGCVLMPLVIGAWAPTLSPRDARYVTSVVRGTAAPGQNGPWCFYGPERSMTLVFGLRAIVPGYEDPVALLAAARAEPNLRVIIESDTSAEARRAASERPPGWSFPPPAPAEPGSALSTLPETFVRAGQVIVDEEQRFDVFRFQP